MQNFEMRLNMAYKILLYLLKAHIFKKFSKRCKLAGVNFEELPNIKNGFFYGSDGFFSDYLSS
jgi:hypothetical protein